MAVAALGIAAIGAAIGWGIGGTLTALAIGWTIGAAVGSYLFGPDIPNVEGPRLNDLTVQSATYGQPIPKVYGSQRIAGNLIWSAGIVEHRHDQEVGGKGGGGATQTTYTYTCSFAVGICEGPIAGIRRIWADGKLLYDAGSKERILQDIFFVRITDKITFFAGTEDQTPDPLMEAHEGVGNVPAYRGLAYVVFEDMPLENYGNRIPNLTFEIASASTSVPVAMCPTEYFFSDHKGNLWTAYYDDPANYRNSIIKRHVGIDIEQVSKTITYSDSSGSAQPCFLNGNFIRFYGDAYGERLIMYQGETNTVLAYYPVSFYTLGMCSEGEYLYWVENFDNVPDKTKISRSRGFPDGTNIESIWVDIKNSGGHDACGVVIIDGDLVLDVENGRYRFNGFTPEIKIFKPHDPGDYFYFAKINNIILCKGWWYSKIYIFDPETFDKKTIDVYSAGGYPLSSIVADLLNNAGIQSTNYDLIELNNITVHGYTRTNVMGVRDAIQPLAQAYQFDLPEIDYQIKAVKRGGSATVTILDDDLGFGESPTEQLISKRMQEVELPAEIDIYYQDTALDYQINSQRATHKTTISKNVTRLQLPMAMTGTKAIQTAEILLNSSWTGRESYTLQLPMKYAYLSPGDVIVAKNQTMRIIEMSISGIVSITAIKERAEDYISNATVDVTPLPEQPLPTIVGTKLILLDLPMLSDNHNDAVFYAAAYGYQSGWRGCVVYKSNDDGETWAEATVITSAAVVGTTLNALGDGPTTIWDRKNTITVQLETPEGDLSSTTELNALAGANTAAIGAHGRWELVTFRDAVLNSDGTYTLSNLIRGRKGTEHATSKHAVGDTFVLLTANAIQRISQNADLIGMAQQYKAVSIGANIADTDAISFTNTGVALKCYSPVHIMATRNSAGDTIITWRRRNRIMGEWRDYVGVPMSEQSEQYEIDILDGATVKRTLSSSTETATYSASDQVTDFGIIKSSIDFNLYQLSAIVGRGYPAEVRNM